MSKKSTPIAEPVVETPAVVETPVVETPVEVATIISVFANKKYARIYRKEYKYVNYRYSEHRGEGSDAVSHLLAALQAVKTRLETGGKLKAVNVYLPVFPAPKEVCDICFAISKEHGVAVYFKRQE